MPHALAGIRVLDLSRLLPGPFATMMLGDLGAEVIKVEEVRTGDPTRHSPPLIAKTSAAFLHLNRNKKSIALDLKQTAARDIFLQLAATADCIIEQFRPGVVDRLGIGYEVVREINPRVVYCALTGFGQTGPHAGRSGHDMNYLALAGVLGLTTDARGKPVIPGIQVADLAGGMIAAYGILAALMARQHTGCGQYVDVSMYDVMMAMLAIPASHHFAGRTTEVGGKYALSGAYPFYNVYETGDGKFMTLGALEPKFWANFCQCVGRPELIARQFDDGEQRESLFAEVRAIFKAKTQSQWIEAMRDADCCCEPVLSLTEAFAHPQAKAREMVMEMAAVGGEQPGSAYNEQLGFAYKLSQTPPRVESAAPALGEHTDELLAALGIGQDQRRRLCEAGIIVARK